MFRQPAIFFGTICMLTHNQKINLSIWFKPFSRYFGNVWNQNQTLEIWFNLELKVRKGRYERVGKGRPKTNICVFRVIRPCLSFIKISPTLIFLFLFFDKKKHNFMKNKSCSRWVHIVLHLLLHSASWFQEKGMHGYCGGCGGVLRSDFTKNQDIRYKKINKNKK